MTNCRCVVVVVAGPNYNYYISQTSGLWWSVTNTRYDTRMEGGREGEGEPRSSFVSPLDANVAG